MPLPPSSPLISLIILLLSSLLCNKLPLHCSVYFPRKGEEALYRIPAEAILAVEEVDIGAFGIPVSDEMLLKATSTVGERTSSCVLLTACYVRVL